MADITVDRWEKTTTRCPQCDSMRKHFSRWYEGSVEHDVTVNNHSAEEDRDYLISLGATSAPVYIVKREGRETVISGDNPDILLDALEGDDDFWEVDCSL